MEITGSFRLTGEGSPIEESFRDGNGQSVDGLEGFFPIVNISNMDPWSPIGTGFFISNNGLFATAKHVLSDYRPNQADEYLAGVQMIRRDDHVIIRQIHKVVAHPTHDVAIGFLFDKKFSESREQTVNKCFAITAEIPQVGERIATFAFPKPQSGGNQDSFELHFTSHGITGEVEEYYPNGRDSTMLRGPCYRTTMTTAGGASGAPVAFGNGYVFGIVSTGVADQPVNYVSSISSILDLEIPNLQLPSGEIRESMTVRDLAALDLVKVDD